jgi:YVTN family beta-propeller protein
MIRPSRSTKGTIIMRGGRQAGGRLAPWMLALVAALGVGSLGGAPSAGVPLAEAQVEPAGGVAAPAEPITIPVGENPGGIALHPSSPRLYVANYSDDTVSVIDTERNAVIATINTRTDPDVRTAPNDIALSPRGDRAFVALPNSNQLAVLDTSDNSLLRAVPIGSDPNERAIPNGVAVAPTATAST